MYYYLYIQHIILCAVGYVNFQRQNAADREIVWVVVEINKRVFTKEIFGG